MRLTLRHRRVAPLPTQAKWRSATRSPSTCWHPFLPMREFKLVFGKDKPDIDQVTEAIAEFEKPWLRPTEIDQYLLGNKAALNKDELAGYRLFNESGCVAATTAPTWVAIRSRKWVVEAHLATPKCRRPFGCDRKRCRPLQLQSAHTAQRRADPTFTMGHLTRWPRRGCDGAFAIGQETSRKRVDRGLPQDPHGEQPVFRLPILPRHRTAHHVPPCSSKPMRLS